VCKNKGEVASCSGLFWNTNDGLIKGYNKKIGTCDALYGEW
jgi:hypothetical protein